MTGLAMYDAIGSITIGCLLGCTAVFLIGQNRSLLIGAASCYKLEKAWQVIGISRY